MSQHIKPDNISGLAGAHPLNANIAQFFEFGQLDKELVGDTALTIGSAPVQADADIGSSRKFTDASSVAETLQVDGDRTVLVVCRPYGTKLYGGDGMEFVGRGVVGGDSFTVNYSGYSGVGFESLIKVDYGDERNLKADDFASDAAFHTGQAFAIHMADTEEMKWAYNGTVGGSTDTGSTIEYANTLTVNLFNSANAADDFNVGAIVVFNKMLQGSVFQ